MSPPGRPAKAQSLAEQIAPQVAELAAHGRGRNAIARELDVAPSTVTKAAEYAGVTFDGAATQAATAVRVMQAEDARAELAELSAQIATTAGRRLLIEVGAPVLDPATVRALAIAYGVSTDKLAALMATLPDPADADARAALDALMDAITAPIETDPTPPERNPA